MKDKFEYIVLLLVSLTFMMCIYGLFTQTFELNFTHKQGYDFNNVKAAFLKKKTP